MKKIRSDKRSLNLRHGKLVFIPLSIITVFCFGLVLVQPADLASKTLKDKDASEAIKLDVETSNQEKSLTSVDSRLPDSPEGLPGTSPDKDQEGIKSSSVPARNLQSAQPNPGNGTTANTAPVQTIELPHILVTPPISVPVPQLPVPSIVKNIL